MKLTEREKDILRLLCFTDEYISEKLLISTPTVKTHLVNIRKKFTNVKTSSRAAILVESIRQGVIDINEVITK